MSWPLGEHHIAIDRTARQRLSCLFGESLTLSRRRIGDDDRASNQKRHTCENEKLKFGGGDERPTRFWPPEHARLTVDGIVRQLHRDLGIKPILDLGPEVGERVARSVRFAELAKPRIDAEEEIVLELPLGADGRAIENLAQVRPRERAGVLIDVPAPPSWN